MKVRIFMLTQKVAKSSYKVQHIAESDNGGGAPKAAHKLHTSLSALGVDSQMLVADKRTSDPTSSQLKLNLGFFAKRRRRRLARRQKQNLKQYRMSRSEKLEIFTHGMGIFGWDLVSQLPKADAYFLHWSDRLIDYKSLFSQIPPDIPVLWRMPDMNAMTGGCHYAWDCKRYSQNCGRCPQLGSTIDKDLSRKVFHHKQLAYEKRNPNLTCFVAPSRWLANQAQKSSLLRDFEIAHIPTGVDSDTFKPTNKGSTLSRHGLPTEVPLLLFVAQSVTNYRKGFDLVISALRGMSEPDKVALVALGDVASNLDLPSNCYAIGRVESSTELAALYSAADIFVHPAREDNLPNVVLEAMSCGTPCVSFDVGGLPELIQNGENGLLVERGNAKALLNGIEDLLTNSDLQKRMSKNCRDTVLREFREEVMALRYHDLLNTLLERAENLRSGIEY